MRKGGSDIAPSAWVLRPLRIGSCRNSIPPRFSFVSSSPEITFRSPITMTGSPRPLLFGFALSSGAFLFPRRQGPDLGVEQGRAEVEHVAGGLPDERERRRPARGQAAGQRVLLEGELRLELLRQALHADIVGQADDLDRLDAVVSCGALDALEQLLADAAPPVLILDGKGRLGVDVPVERRLFAPDRLVRAQFRSATHMAVDEGSVQEIPLAEAILGIAHKEVVRHPAAEALMAAARIEPQQVVAESFHVRWPQPPDFHVE